MIADRTRKQKIEMALELETSIRRNINAMDQWIWYYFHVGDKDGRRMILGRQVHDLEQGLTHMRVTLTEGRESQFTKKYREWADGTIANIRKKAGKEGHGDCDLSSYNVLNKNVCNKSER